MAKQMKNKMKHWRKMGNQIVIMIPKETTVTKEDGTEEKVTYEEPHVMTGRQLKAFNSYSPKEKPPITGVLKELFFRAGLVNINHEVEIKGVTA